MSEKTQKQKDAEKSAGLLADFMNQTQGGGTSTPGQVSNKAFQVGLTAGKKAQKSLLPGGTIPVLSSEIDQTTGELPRAKSPLFPAGSQYTELSNLGPVERAALQRKMYALNLYPKDFTPVYGFISSGGEDITAITRLMQVGEQIGKGDLNEVIKIAKSDPKVMQLLDRSGGYKEKGPELTDAATAAANLESYYLDMFNIKPSKKDLKEYTTALNAAERASNGSIGAQQAEDILLSVATNKANELIESAKLGDPRAQDRLQQGQLGRTVRAIRNAYADNGLPVDDKKVYAKAVKAARSDVAYDNVVQGIRLNAKTQWAPFADYIDQGQTVKDLVDPYVTIRSQITGIPKEQIKMSDMTDVIDADGKLKSINKYKSEKYQSDEYLASDNFKQQKLNDIQAVLRNFGIG